MVVGLLLESAVINQHSKLMELHSEIKNNLIKVHVVDSLGLGILLTGGHFLKSLWDSTIKSGAGLGQKGSLAETIFTWRQWVWRKQLFEPGRRTLQIWQSWNISPLW